MAETKKNVTAAPPQPTALFLLGIADDGLVQLLMEPPDHRLRHSLLGNLAHQNQVSLPGLKKEIVVLASGQQQKLRFTTPRVVVNCIVDPDICGKSLSQAQRIIDHLRPQYKSALPVINPPANILRTKRDAIYDAFKHRQEGVRVPRTVCITPKSVDDVVKQTKALKLKPPFIIRSTGTHGGKDMQKIDSFSKENLLKLERYAYDGRAFYLTEWVDFKSKDGLYRKSRLMVVGGHVIARHMIISKEWMIHSKSREMLMNGNAELQQQEKTFLAEAGKRISQEAKASLGAIHGALGLDYFGIDCSLREDGSLVVFEINAAFNAMVQDGLKDFPYLAQPMQRVIDSFNRVVAEKASLKKAA